MIVYKTTNLVNGRAYVGKDAANNPNYLGSGVLLNQAIEKHGVENFRKDVLEECRDLTHLAEREKYWIDKLNAVKSNDYYNIAPGGYGGDTFTDNPNSAELRKKNGLAGKDRKWIKNSETGEHKFIKPSELENYVSKGWVLTGLPGSFFSKGKVWIHDPATNKSKMIDPSLKSEYLSTGWLNGRAPRDPIWNENNRLSQLRSASKK